jgi:hypothetical protein
VDPINIGGSTGGSGGGGGSGVQVPAANQGQESGGFTPAEGNAGGERTQVLTSGFWQEVLEEVGGHLVLSGSIISSNEEQVVQELVYKCNVLDRRCTR